MLVFLLLRFNIYSRIKFLNITDLTFLNNAYCIGSHSTDGRAGTIKQPNPLPVATIISIS